MTAKAEDGKTIYIVNSTGKLRRLYAPFKVVCKEAVGNYRPGNHLFVDRILEGNNAELIYVISNGAYFHHFFSIVANF